MPAELLDAVACPKRMAYGPCGGVGFDGSCEVADFPCVFLDAAPVAWHGVEPAARTEPRMAADPVPDPVPSPGAAAMRALLATRPIVVADFPARALDADSLAACARALAGSADAVLAGDSGTARVQFPPAYRARLIQDAGMTPWMGVNNRDRNRVALEAELAALAHAGVAGVHCVTGDHPDVGSRPDAAAVFDLDSTETAALARRAGHLVSVAEAPLSPPVAARPGRLLEKERAGAELCFVNHAGGVAPVAAFVAEARAIGVTLGFIPCVPIVLDRGSAELIRGFTSLALPEGYLDGILAASDPWRAGITAAVELSRRFLDVDGVVGVDLSGGAAPGGELAFAEALAEIAQGVLA